MREVVLVLPRDRFTSSVAALVAAARAEGDESHDGEYGGDGLARRNTKLIGVSVDTVDSHHAWSSDIAETQGAR
ncbi:MAG: hypothetical protein M3P34_09730 [Actinomycetota bacterium]|nr:hypothetical protein [Actinomycetota bacterium]